MGLCCSSTRGQDSGNIVSKVIIIIIIPQKLNYITIRHRIFEGGAESDCLRLVVGKRPLSIAGQVNRSKSGQVNRSKSSLSVPVSPYYARVLAELAHERGFDGYLLNFECPLTGVVETRAVAAWITLLQSEILARVGPHGETHWFVVTNS